MKKIHIFLIFLVVVVLQLFIPAKMILDKEDILNTGIEYKFKTQPIDPSDPFRGKYITLNYELDSFESKDSTWLRGEEVLVYLEKDSSGFAKVKDVSRTKLDLDNDYVRANVRWNLTKSNTVNFEFPFNRFYMEEFKAKPAEDLYRKYNNTSDSVNITYALVSIKDGEAVLENVLINDKPIKDYLMEEDYH